MAPGTPAAEIDSPRGVAAITPVISSGVLNGEALDEICSFAFATIPSEIAALFMPYSRHVAPLHCIDLPAFVAAGPTEKLTPVKSEGECKVH
jgi:hypothetical protein